MYFNIDFMHMQSYCLPHDSDTWRGPLICWPFANQQLVLGDHQPADPAADLAGEELMAAEKDWGPGGGEGLPALPAGPFHLLHKEPRAGAETEPVQQRWGERTDGKQPFKNCAGFPYLK